MQPYFLPYIGYFQLIHAADLFVLYDNIKYTKKGWINRNRMLLNGSDAVFSLPLAGASDTLDVRQRELAAEFNPRKLLAKFEGAYAKAPHFPEIFALLEKVLLYRERNLFKFIQHSVEMICQRLQIPTKIVVSSELDVDLGLKGQDRVLAMCHALGADTYINPIAGSGLYSRDEFLAGGVELRFLRSTPFEYAQFGNSFVPWLSIVDVLMFNSPNVARYWTDTGYTIIQPIQI